MEDANLRDKKRRDQRGQALELMNDDLKAIGEALPFWLVKRTAEIYTYVNIEYCWNILNAFCRSISEESMMIAVLGEHDKTIDANDVASAIEHGECGEILC